MSRQVKVGELVIDQFPVFNLDGFTKRSGETSFVVSIWKDGVVSAIPVTVSEIGVSGEYKFSFTPDDEGYWRIEVGINYNKDVFAFEYDAEVGGVEDIYEMVRRLLGLSHENIFIDNTVFDFNGQMTAARVRLFDTKVHCNLATDGGSETLGLLATYSLETTWEAVNQFKVFKQVIEP